MLYPSTYVLYIEFSARTLQVVATARAWDLAAADMAAPDTVSGSDSLPSASRRVMASPLGSHHVKGVTVGGCLPADTGTRISKLQAALGWNSGC